MAATRKAAAAALNKMDLTKAKDDDGGKLRIVGHTAKQLAREYNDAQAQIEELQELQKERKQRIIDLASEKRLEAENEGRFYSTAQIETEDDEFLQILWTDRFKALDTSHQPVLKRAFGKHYDDLFRETIEVKAADNVTVEEMQTALGSRAFDTLQKFVTVAPALKLKKGFLETRANLRGTFDATTNTSIDTVVAKVAYAPSLKPVRPK